MIPLPGSVVEAFDEQGSQRDQLLPAGPKGGFDSLMEEGRPEAEDDNEASFAHHRFRKAANNVKAAQSVQKRMITGETLLPFDAYAQDVEPPTKFGGLVSVVVIVLTLAYSGYLLYLYITRPMIVSNVVEWSDGAGLFSMPVTCQTLSGCYLSNSINEQWTAARVDPAQMGCIYLEYQETYIVNMTFTMYPRDGLVVIYNRSNTSPNMPPKFGYTTTSDANCNGPMMCVEGVKAMPAPAGPGLNVASHVVTYNKTRSDAGRRRGEWFVMQMNAQDSVVDASSGPCASDEFLANSDSLVQSRIEMQPSFNTITVTRDTNWLALWGTFGGAYELFLEVGGLILASTAVIGLLNHAWEFISGCGKRRKQQS